MHGVPLGWLPPGVKLKNYLEGPQAAGACRLEMRKISNGEMILMVHAPGGEQGGVGIDGKGSGKGVGNFDTALNRNIKQLLLGMPGRFIYGADFKAK
jgi:hypothetical protein